MSPLFILVAAAATGIDVGWQPLPEGGYEYTIQIEPDLAETFLHGEHEIVSSVPSHIDARRYRIVVGAGKLSRIDAGPQAAVAVKSKPIAKPSPPVAKQATHPPARAPIAVVEPPQESPLEPLPQPQADPLPLAGPSLIKDLPEPPDDTSPTTTAPAEPDVAPHSQPPAHNPFAHQPPAEPNHDVASSAPLNVAETPPKLLQSGYQEATLANRPKSSQEPPPTVETEPARPWTAFVLALVLLCCSLGANAYLGWIAWDARARYRSTLSKLGTSGAA